MDKNLVKFDDIKEELKDIISKKSKTDLFPGEQGVTLLDGFFNFPIQSEFSGHIIIGGPSIPMIVVVGNQSGRIYYFALKMLLPDLSI